MPYHPDDLLAIGDSSRILGVSVETLRRWERAGKITATRTASGDRRFRRSDIEALAALDSAPNESTAERKSA